MTESEPAQSRQSNSRISPSTNLVGTQETLSQLMVTMAAEKTPPMVTKRRKMPQSCAVAAATVDLTLDEETYDEHRLYHLGQYKPLKKSRPDHKSSKKGTTKTKEKGKGNGKTTSSRTNPYAKGAYVFDCPLTTILCRRVSTYQFYITLQFCNLNINCQNVNPRQTSV